MDGWLYRSFIKSHIFLGHIAVDLDMTSVEYILGLCVLKVPQLIAKYIQV